MSHCLANERLACAGRAKEQEPLGHLAKACKEVRALHGPHYQLHNSLLGGLEASCNRCGTRVTRERGRERARERERGNSAAAHAPMSSNLTMAPLSMISFSIISIMRGSRFFNSSGTSSSPSALAEEEEEEEEEALPPRRPPRPTVLPAESARARELGGSPARAGVTNLRLRRPAPRAGARVEAGQTEQWLS